MTVKRTFWICSIAVALAVAAMGMKFRPVVISGESMRPALHDGQVALMDRQTQNSADLKRGDIVVFHHGRELFIKRVMGLEGDKIRLLSFANGATGMVGDAIFPMDRILRYARTHPGQVHISSVEVPRGTVFVVGDNRTYSVDSRDFGPVPLSTIVGRVVSTREAVAALPHHFLPVAFAPEFRSPGSDGQDSGCPPM